MITPEAGALVIFHEHIPQGAGADPLVVERQAIVIARTPPRCRSCGDPFTAHDRPGRKHAYVEDDRLLLELRVDFPAHPPYHPIAESGIFPAIPPGRPDEANTWRNT